MGQLIRRDVHMFLVKLTAASAKALVRPICVSRKSPVASSQSMLAASAMEEEMGSVHSKHNISLTFSTNR